MSLNWELLKSRKDKVLCHWVVRVAHVSDKLIPEPVALWAYEGIPLDENGNKIINDDINTLYFFFFKNRYDAERFCIRPKDVFFEYTETSLKQMELKL